jgi:hypothetical protein
VTRVWKTATTTKEVRQPNSPPIRVPSGTPSTVARFRPRETLAITRPWNSGGTSEVARTRHRAKKVACGRAVMTRKTTRSAKLFASAVPRVPMTKTAMEPMIRAVRGTRVVTMVSSGPPIITVTA